MNQNMLLCRAIYRMTCNMNPPASHDFGKPYLKRSMNLKSNMTQPIHEMQQLSALASLLSFRNGGQLDPEAINDPPKAINDPPKAAHGHQKAINGPKNHNNESNSSSEDIAQIAFPSQKRDDGLRKRFLDRLSELIANDKGGNHVSCAVMRENVENECADIWIARNSGFVKGDGTNEEKDFAFLDKLESVLRSVAQDRSDKLSGHNSNIGIS
jgi:hypothetical protein